MPIPDWARPHRRNPLNGLPPGYTARWERLHLLAIAHDKEILLLVSPLLKGRGMVMQPPQLAVRQPTKIINGRHFIRLETIDQWLAGTRRPTGKFEAWLVETFIPDAVQALWAQRHPQKARPKTAPLPPKPR